MKRFGLIGRSISHSFSPAYFNKKFEVLGLVDCSYHLFDLSEPSEIKSLLLEENLAGLNVTVPYKTSVIPYLSELSPEAQIIGAVNCLQRMQGGWKGHNTDIAGIKHTIGLFSNEILLKHALVLGDGGAAKAVIFVLELLGITYTSASRSGPLRFDQLTASHIRECQLIIQTTPVGMYPHVNECLEIPYEAIRKGQILFDLIYNPDETIFLKRGKLAGAKTINGMPMLIEQAERSWQIWNSPPSS